MSRKTSEIDYYTKQYKEMDEFMTNMKNEKENYLGEFQSLKNKYESVIEKLHKSHISSRLDLVKEQDQHKDTKMHLHRHAKKFEEIA